MQLFDNQLYDTGIEFRHVDGYPDTDQGCVMVIPGRYWHDRIAEVSEALQRYPWILAFRTGDEEDLLTIDKIVHPNIKWWIQTPRTDRFYRDARWFGVGWTPAFNTPVFTDRPLDVFLSAQNTHKRRNQAFAALGDVDAVKVVAETQGFTQGMDPDHYARHMLAAKIAPCPSGAISPDSFRLWEALQSHCVPIADNVSPDPTYYASGFWERMFPDVPFPRLDTYEQLPGYIEDQLAAWPANANRVAAWWMREKRRMTLDLLDDLEALRA